MSGAESTEAALVRAFYAEIWEAGSHGAAHRLLVPGFRFRGSLGPERVGVPGFLDYVETVRGGLGGYACEIEELITEPGRAAARMRFSGLHRAPFFGVEATGRRIAWAGAAFFGMAEGRIASLWVLGDVDAVRAQLGAGPEAEL